MRMSLLMSVLDARVVVDFNDTVAVLRGVLLAWQPPNLHLGIMQMRPEHDEMRSKRHYLVWRGTEKRRTIFGNRKIVSQQKEKCLVQLSSLALRSRVERIREAMMHLDRSLIIFVQFTAWSSSDKAFRCCIENYVVRLRIRCSSLILCIVRVSANAAKEGRSKREESNHKQNETDAREREREREIFECCSVLRSAQMRYWTSTLILKCSMHNKMPLILPIFSRCLAESATKQKRAELKVRLAALHVASASVLTVVASQEKVCCSYRNPIIFWRAARMNESYLRTIKWWFWLSLQTPGEDFASLIVNYQN